MRRLERFNLIDRIGRELQSRMTYSDIRIFLGSFGVDVTKELSSTNSKWIYVKELLTDVDDTVVLQIADELDIAHGHTITGSVVHEDSRFWIPGYFRLFVTHLSEHKLKATALKEGLKKYAISCFVAHEDINPTLEWQDEIEKALASMDALAAILILGFHESKWTDQEIGYALGRGTLVVPLWHGLDPYGFIGKLQGVSCQGRTVAQVSTAVFQALSSNGVTKNKVATALVDQIVGSAAVESGLQFLDGLRQIETLGQSHLERLRDNLSTNPVLSANSHFVNELNNLLKERDVQIYEQPSETFAVDDDIPF